MNSEDGGEDEVLIGGNWHKYPHCNTEVLHAPGECVYCDHYPERQRLRLASKTPFTPNESNGWSGNTAAPAGQPHTHMGFTFTPDEPSPAPRPSRLAARGEPVCDRPSRPNVCNLRRGHEGSCPTYVLSRREYFFCRTLGWHPRSLRVMLNYDGVSFQSQCTRCGFIGLTDSQGNLF